MLDHVSISVRDLAQAAVFYDAITDALGYPCVYRFDYAVGYGLRNTSHRAGVTTVRLDCDLISIRPTSRRSSLIRTGIG